MMMAPPAVTADLCCTSCVVPHAILFKAASMTSMRFCRLGCVYSPSGSLERTSESTLFDALCTFMCTRAALMGAVGLRISMAWSYFSDHIDP